jgi:hypothetical protein
VKPSVKGFAGALNSIGENSRATTIKKGEPEWLTEKLFREIIYSGTGVFIAQTLKK